MFINTLAYFKDNFSKYRRNYENACITPYRYQEEAEEEKAFALANLVNFLKSWIGKYGFVNGWRRYLIQVRNDIFRLNAVIRDVVIWYNPTNKVLYEVIQDILYTTN